MGGGLPVGRVIVNSLIDMGVDVVFGLPGTHIYHVFKEFDDIGFREVIITRHETNAVFMADVYGRLRGLPGVSIITAGPGLTNALTGIAQAFSVSSPVLIISGDVPRGSFYDFHGVDIPNVLEFVSSYITKDSYTVSDTGDVEWAVKSGYFLANSGRKGPVHIVIPKDLLDGSVGYKGINIMGDVTVDNIQILGGVSESFSGRILVVLGPESAYPEYREAITKFIGECKTPFISEVSTVGFIPQDNILFSGFYEKGFSLHPLSKKLISMCDTLVFIGVRPESIDSDSLVNLTGVKTRLIYILPSLNSRGSLGDAEGDSGIQFLRVHGRDAIVLYGDLNVILGRLVEDVGVSMEFEVDIKRGIYGRYESIVGELENTLDVKPMSQGNVMKIISEYIPNESNILVDVGANESWARDLIAPIRRVRYLYAGAFGSLGFSFGGSIGSKFAVPDRETISITGDGSLLMSLMELQTLAYYNIPIKVLVVNDGSYGILEHLSRKDFSVPIDSDIGRVDFSKVAEAFGIEAVSVSTLEGLEDVLRDIFKSPDKPFLVDIICRKDDIPPLLR